MKTQNIILTAVIFLLLLFGACKEVTVTTKVNPDGTFTRIITVTGDSAEVFSSDLPFPVDETWARAFSKDTADSAKYMQTYTKSYRNCDELNTEIKSDTGSYKNMERNVAVIKKFRFFFSYLTFKEVYKSANPFTSLDYREYLTEEEILWYTGQKIPVTPADSARKNEAGDSVALFFYGSALADVEAITREGIKKLNNPELNSIDISIYHDSLFNNLEDWYFKEGDDFIELYRKWSGNESFTLLYDLDPPIFEEYTKKMEKLGTIFQMEGYTEEVEMPGLITATNSAMLKGNQVRWDFQPMSVMIRDYEMYVESRVVNYWAFILGGIILLALVVLLVIKAAR